jgi:hypothetical protein
MASVLAIGPKVRGGEFLSAITIRNTPYFGGEIKPSAPCRKILRHIAKLYEYERDIS